MRLARQPFTAIAIVLVIALGIPLASDTPSAAATTLSFKPVKPIVGEYTWVTGRMATKVIRPVHLQYYKSGSGWTVYPFKYQGDGALGRTFKGGYFRFRPRGAAPYRILRAVAPRVRINGRWYAAQVSSPRRLYAVRQTADIARFVPVPIGQAKDGSPSGLIPVNVAFTPARRGRKILLQNNRSGSWKTIATGIQNSAGTATLNILPALATNSANRVVAASYNGARFWTSDPERGTVRSPWFVDNFNGTRLDTTKWNYRLLGSRKALNRQCSESSRKSVSVASGTLRLQTIRIPKTDLDPAREFGYRPGLETDCPHGQFYNGHISTEDETRGNFRHGFMAARIRLQPQSGHHGGFWSQPVDPKAASGSEMDAIEYYGNASSRIQHTVYRDGTARAKSFQRRDYLLPDGKRWSDGYHIFSIEWTPKVYIFRIDGQETFRTSAAVSQTPQYLITSLLSSDYELKNLPATGPYKPLVVDWVRSWR